MLLFFRQFNLKKLNIQLKILNLIKKKLKVSSDQVQIIAGLKKADKILQVNFSENILESDIIKRIFN